MEEIKLASVKFKSAGKIYYFSTNLKLKKDDRVVVETARGLELGEISQELKDISEFNLDTELKKIVRKATKKDIENYQKNVRDAKQALVTCKEIVSRYDVSMQLTNCEYTLDKAKVIFMYTSDDRVDFRELLKELAVVFKCRIELRQIGVRDEVKRIGGNGVCGRELCCCSFLRDFETVSIKMAKEQNISLNPSKISGNCGRLMCCLKYEQEVYEDKLKKMPNIGAIVKTPDGQGEVDGIEPLKEVVKVKIKSGEIYKFKRYEIKDIKVIKDAAREHTDSEEKEYQKELKELEKLELKDSKMKGGE